MIRKANGRTGRISSFTDDEGKEHVNTDENIVWKGDEQSAEVESYYEPVKDALDLNIDTDVSIDLNSDDDDDTIAKRC